MTSSRASSPFNIRRTVRRPSATEAAALSVIGTKRLMSAGVGIGSNASILTSSK